ncbi:MAG: protein kinase domain-containing protein [Gemmatimonadota bacterium]
MPTYPDPLLERLRQAVAPDYRIERELSSGGMGRVYLAHEVMLNRPVAIKVLRPELATADGAEAFLREAQMLASIRHPNVVVIYRPGEGQGLQFYVMELVNGPTLESRVAAGPVPARDVASIGRDLLDGLETVHRLGLVHRDIKPSNVFLLPNRAVLGDFGIARPPLTEEDDPHSGEGTPDYMAPEQVEHKPITALTDIYSMGVVLYEAASGKRFHEQGEHIDWSGVTSGLARVLRRAVAKNPTGRWPDAAAFRSALLGPQRAPIPSLVKIGAAALLVTALAVAIVRWPTPTPAPARIPGAPNVMFEAIEYVGPSEHRPVADSLLHMVHGDLGRHVNFGDSTPPSLTIRARMTVSGADVVLRLTGGIPASEFRVPFAQWPALRDSLEYQILLGIWADRSPLAPSLPLRALPRTPEGLVRFLEAEQLVAETRWDDAHRAYLQAEATDSTCWICSWRITDIDRWLGREPDPERVQRYRVHADSLPPLFRSIIHAAQLPLRERLDTLRAAAEKSREFFLGWFQLGDELFHRGPLVGHRRAEAIPALERAARLRPDFGPAWEHLAWVATAEGDSASAAAALDSLRTQRATPDGISQAIRALLEVGFAWRFLPEDAALRVTQQVTSAPATQSSANLGAGPRLLPTFDVPRGAIALGEMLAHSPSRDLQRSGLIAQTLTLLSLGRVDSTRALARQLTTVAPEPALDFFYAELVATLAVLDPDAVSVDHARDGLRVWLLNTDPHIRYRAAWISSVLEQRSRLPGDAPRELALTVTAEALAFSGQTRAALRLVDHIDLDSVARSGDPFLRMLVHFRRADWRAENGDIEGAKAELTWHEHTAVIGLPTGLPQAAEVDWAFGTLARWRLARLLDGRSSTDRGGGETCQAYTAVTRYWHGAPPPFGVRADTAETRARELACERSAVR